MSGPAVGETIAVHGRDDHMEKAELGHASATFRGWRYRAHAGGPGRHVAECGAAREMPPMIIMVACRCCQHSPMLGQLASSQTV